MFLALLRPERELDVAEVLQVDPERVGGALRQITGGQVEDPLVGASAERRVRNIGVGGFVDVIHGTPRVGQHGYRAVAAGKHRSRAGDRVAAGVAHRELHRNCAALLEHAAAIGVDWR